MDYILFLMIGVIAGTMGGLLGVGGSIIIIPALVLLMSFNNTYTGSSQHLIQAAGMICNFFISLPAAYSHWRSGAVQKEIVMGLIPSSLFGVLMGVSLSNITYFAGENGKYLSLMLGVFLFYIAFYNIWQLIRVKKHNTEIIQSQPEASKPGIIFSGWLVGIIAGLLGVGGGAICVPCQQAILRIPLRNAIANSSCTIISLVLVGSVYKNATLAEHGYYYIDALKLAGCIVPTAIFASYFGSKLTHTINQRFLRTIFAVFMMVAATMIFYKAANL